MRPVALLLASLPFSLLFNLLGAQEPRREGALGEVRDAEGRPFAGATVHLVHRAHPAVTDPGYGEHLQVTVDDRGRFRASVLAGMPYTVWAEGPGGAPRWRSTVVAHDVVAGVPVVLREGEAMHRRSVQITADPSWQEPLSFVAEASLGGLALREALVPLDGAVTLPAWPVGELRLVVFAAQQPVHSFTLATTLTAAKRLGGADGKPAEGDAPTSIPASTPAGTPAAAPIDGGEDAALLAALAKPAALVLPKQQAISCRLTDEKGVPLAGVPVSLDRAPLAQAIGVTDGDGTIALLAAGEPPDGPWIGHSPGHAEFPLRREHMPPVPGGGKPAQPLDLAAGFTVRGQIQIGEGEAVASAPLVLDASIRNSDNGWWWGVNPRLLHTAADGAVVLTGRHAQFPFRLSLVLTPAQQALLTGDSKVPLWPVAIVAPETADPTKDFGTVRLDRLAAVEIAIRSADGTPPGPIALALFPLVTKRVDKMPVRALLARTDRLGRMRVLLPRGTEVAVFAAAAGGSAFGIASAGGPVLERRLDTTQVHRIQVHDADGRPVVGASAWVSQFAIERLQDEAKRAGYLLQEPLVRSWSPYVSGITDADGRVDLVVPLPGLQSNGCIKRLDGSTMQVRFDPSEPDQGLQSIEFVPNAR